MPRLPGDSPLLYPDNTGSYDKKEFTWRKNGDCSYCDEGSSPLFGQGWVMERYSVGKWGCAESSNNVCQDCYDGAHDILRGM